jgi:hypothetical protein
MARHPAPRLVEKRDRRHDLAGRAVAALEGVAFDESALHWMEPLAVRQPLDCGDLVVLVGDRKREAGKGSATVDVHRAGAALPVVAALLAARQAEMVAQHVKQCHPRIKTHLAPLTVDAQDNTLARLK